MTRKEEFLKYIKENRQQEVEVLSPLLDDILYLEERLTELRKLPFIEVHPVDKGKQRTTPAAKLYKELLQQYNNCMKLIILKSSVEDSDEESPLRQYMKQRIQHKEVERYETRNNSDIDF